MADFNAYHALGQNPAGQPNDPRYPPSRGQNLPPNPQPHITPTPSGYQQVGAPNDGFPQQQYGVSPQPSHGTQGIGYVPASGSDGVGGITTQMGGLGLSSDAAGLGPARTHRRKERHAYHDISQPPGSSQGMAPAPPQFLQGGQMNAGLGSPAMGPQAIPGSSQLNSGDRLRSGE